MGNGYVKAAVCSPTINVADVMSNSKIIRDKILEANDLNCNLLVTPELSLTGATCGDLFHQYALTNGAEEALKFILEETKGTRVVTTIGLPIVFNNSVYNCVAVILSGKILGIVPKTNLNYNNQISYFNNYNGNVTEITYCGALINFGRDLIFRSYDNDKFKFAIEIGEDILLQKQLSNDYANHGANIIINPSCIKNLVSNRLMISQVISAQSYRLNVAYIHCNACCGESTSEAVYGGNNLISVCGNTRLEVSHGCCDVKYYFIDTDEVAHYKFVNKSDEALNPGDYRIISFMCNEFKDCPKVSPLPFIPDSSAVLKDRCEFIMDMQCEALCKRLAFLKTYYCLIELDNGLQSALALIIAGKAYKNLGISPENIIAVTKDKNDTNLYVKLANSLGCIVMSREQLDNEYSEQNILRVLTQTLSDLAYKKYNISVNNFVYGINIGVPATLIKYILDEYSRSVNSDIALAIQGMLHPPEQPIESTDEVKNPSVKQDLYDFFLYYVVSKGFMPSKILCLAIRAYSDYSENIIISSIKQFYKSLFECLSNQHCIPEGPQIGNVCLSNQKIFSIPNDVNYDLWINDLQNI